MWSERRAVVDVMGADGCDEAGPEPSGGTVPLVPELVSAGHV